MLLERKNPLFADHRRCHPDSPGRVVVRSSARGGRWVLLPFRVPRRGLPAPVPPVARGNSIRGSYLRVRSELRAARWGILPVEAVLGGGSIRLRKDPVTKVVVAFVPFGTRMQRNRCYPTLLGLGGGPPKPPFLAPATFGPPLVRPPCRGELGLHASPWSAPRLPESYLTPLW